MPSIGERARMAEGLLLDLALRDGHPVVEVLSPPGGRKTMLVESLAATAVHLGMRVAVMAPRHEQVVDLLRRLVRDYPGAALHVLQSASRTLPADLAGHPRISMPVSRPQLLPGGPAIVVGVAAKFGVAVEGFRLPEFDLLVCDEAYQLPFKDIAPIIAIASQTVLVGDPGQLPPLVRVDAASFEAARYKVHWPGPKELRRRHPEIPRIELPASWRFPQDSVDFIQPAFYPELPFESGVERDARRLIFTAAGLGGAEDHALDAIADGASLVHLLLPAREVGPEQVDQEVAAVMARLCRRALERRPEWVDQRELGPGDVGCVDAHVASGAEVRRQLYRAGLPDQLMVDTPEIWQGLQRPLMVVKDPLSSNPRLDPFALEPGRACVMLSRHQIGCIMVGREGVEDALGRYEHDSGARPSGAEDAAWRGWNAHATLRERLSAHRRTILA